MGGPDKIEVMRNPVPCDWRREAYLHWCGLTTQGLGVSVYSGDKISNSWLGNPKRVGLSEAQYVAGLQLRANVYPTREALNRGRDVPTLPCRRCDSGVESCSHILGQCLAVKLSRFARHNKICVLLAGEATRAGWQVVRELRIRGPSGELRIPDLVFRKEDLALVVDVTVRFEFSPDTLEAARAEKVAYYRPYAPELMRELVGVTRLRFFGFPVGARGKWPSFKDRLLSDLGLSKARAKRFAMLVSRRTLLYSLDILRDFQRPVDESEPDT